MPSSPKTKRSRCNWCDRGKPPEVPHFRNQGCSICEQKPLEINGIKLKSTAEWSEIAKKLSYTTKKGGFSTKFHWSVLRGYQEGQENMKTPKESEPKMMETVG